MAKLLSQYWKTILWVIVIILLSTMKVRNITGANLLNIPHFDKIIHFGLYAVLLTFWIIDFHKKRVQFVKSMSLLIIFSSIILGGVMELVQTVIKQERSGDFFDFLANAIGVILAFLLFKHIAIYRKLMLRVFS